MKNLFSLLILLVITTSCSTTRYSTVPRRSVTGILCEQNLINKEYPLKFISNGYFDGYSDDYFGNQISSGFELFYTNDGRTYKVTFPSYLVSLVADTVSSVTFIYDLESLSKIKLQKGHLWGANFVNLVVSRYFNSSPCNEIIVHISQEEIDRLASYAW